MHRAHKAARASGGAQDLINAERDNTMARYGLLSPNLGDFEPLVALGTQVKEGTSGDDLLVGTADRDHLFGYDGNDHLVGNGGADYLYGGAGFDSAI
jgi:Ca2+-binding RTX toxin-like protein